MSDDRALEYLKAEIRLLRIQNLSEQGQGARIALEKMLLKVFGLRVKSEFEDAPP